MFEKTLVMISENFGLCSYHSGFCLQITNNWLYPARGYFYILIYMHIVIRIHLLEYLFIPTRETVMLIVFDNFKRGIGPLYKAYRTVSTSIIAYDKFNIRIRAII